MQITLRSSKVAKTGRSEKGAWELIVVADDKTGIEYTTFDKSANAGKGAVLEIGEPTIKEGKHSFKKVVEIISVGEAPASQTTGNRPGMTPELWAEKDRIERWSIESQVVFKGAIELLATGKIELDHPFAKLSLKWGTARMETSAPKTATPGAKPEPAKTEEVKPPAVGDPQTKEELFEYLKNKMAWRDTKTCLSWIVNKCKIAESRLEKDIPGVYDEINALMMWG